MFRIALVTLEVFIRIQFPCLPFTLHHSNLAQYYIIYLNRLLLFYNNFIYLFLAMLGLCCYVGFSLVVERGGPLSVTVCRLLTMLASLAVEHWL